MLKGWVYESMISNYEALLFINALRRHNDSYHYTPIAFAKREEIGMKYRFLCLACPKNDPVQSTHFTGIEIYKPIAGMPYATCLHKLDLDIWRYRF